MPRRQRLLFAVVGLGAAVAIVAWLQRQGEQNRASTPVSPAARGVDDWSLDPPGVASADPDAAVATILEFRQQFGSVLANSELDAAEPNDGGVELAGDRQSFNDFLRAEAGVVSPQTADGDVESSPTVVAAAPAANDDLAASMRQTAALLVSRARQASSAGDAAQQRRFSGLAMLLRAEADALAAADRPER